MEANERRVFDVLTDSKRFVVPIYQRQYSWQEARLVPFWEDVVAKAEEALDGEPRFGHYMGALILSPGGDGFTIGTTARVLVVDGQQRLTTFHLFLAAMREVAATVGEPDIEEAVKGYLFAAPKYGDVGSDARFKLIPTPQDRAMFHLILDEGLAGVRAKHPGYFFGNGRLIKGGSPNAVRALAFFVERIGAFARSGARDEDDPDEGTAAEDPSPRRRLETLLKALLYHLKLVVITLAENDDAQVIFETLNSKAEPLLAMDLVRNNIFHRATGQGESAELLFEAKWKPFDGPFWKEDAPRAKPKRPRIDHFLSHALTAQTGHETSLRELYAEYRAFARPKGKPRFMSVEAELDALTQFAPVYETLERGQGNCPLAALGEKLNLWEVSTAYPLVFHIAVTAQLEETVPLYRLIESYLVRRAVCGLTPKNFNKTFGRLVTQMLEHGTTRATFADAFFNQRGDTVRFPDDAEFAAAVENQQLYRMIGRKERLADILWQMECALRTKYTVATPKPASLSVEHILPQSWSTHWPLPSGTRVEDEQEARADEAEQSALIRRNRLLHTLGNLTLVTLPANMSASNSAFLAKVALLGKSLLALNLAIAERPVWDEEEIEQRGRQLGEIATRIWPSLDAEFGG